MIKESLNALADSARTLFREWRALPLLAGLYLALVACVYLFFSTGVATGWQVALSGLTALGAFLLVFALLAATAHAALPGPKSLRKLAGGSLRGMLKVMLLAVPVAALGLLVLYLTGKLQQYLPKIDEGPRVYVSATMETRPAPLHWQEALVSSLTILLFGILLPLLAAHLWLSAARDGLRATLKGVHRVAARAFAPRSVLVYLAGFFVFAVMTYFVLYTRTSVTNGWGELALFGLRLAFAFLLTLLGWTITLGALARVTPGDAQPVEAAAAPATEPPAEAPPAPAPSVTEEAV